jgi:hypothetical protein
MRGTTPFREQPEYIRTGSFKRGHEKCGGRKRGTPNFFSTDYRRALLEASYLVGYDGNGKNGVVGYLAWVAKGNPRAFLNLLGNILILQEGTPPDEPRLTIEEINQGVREYIELTGKRPHTERQPDQVDSRSPWAWTGRNYPVGPLMHHAIAEPKVFCELLAAAFLRPSKKRRAATLRARYSQ